VSSDLGPEIDIPVALEPSRAFWKAPSCLFLHENGFRLQDQRKTISVLYREIDRVEWAESDRYENGILSGTKYDLRLNVRREAIRIRHFISVGVADSFPSLLKIIVRQMADLAQSRLDLGGRLDGPDWELSTQGIKVGSIRTAWSDVADVDLIDGHVAIWSRNQSYPAHRIRSDSSQARVLLELLDRYVSEHTPANADSALGNFLYRRQTHKALRFFLMGLSIVLLGLSCWLFLQTPPSLVAALCFLVLSVTCAAYPLIFLRKVYDFYQNGIIQRPGYRLFTYKNCDSIRYESRMQYVNAVYGFTRLTMRLASSSPAAMIEIRTQCYGNDKELERTKTKLATQIADRMYAQVMSGTEVLWGPSVKISKEEIHYVSTRLFGGTTRFTVRLTDSLAYTIESGKFRLHRGEENTPLFTIDCEEENFYPGFFLLLRLFNET
jgi:hypothetical protein